MLIKLKNYISKNPFLCLLEFITLILILTTGIIFKQPFWRMLPLCISLVIMFLQANVSRYAFLLGAGNSVLYAVSYFSVTLYTSAIYALLISFPLQLITFFSWNKRSKNNVTELKRMSKLNLFILILICLISWGILFLIFSLFNSSYMILDNTVTILGIVSTVLCMLRFSEYTFFQIFCQCVSVIMYCTMLSEMPAQSTYLIYSIYAVICTVISFINMKKNNLKQVK